MPSSTKIIAAKNVHPDKKSKFDVNKTKTSAMANTTLSSKKASKELVNLLKIVVESMLRFQIKYGINLGEKPLYTQRKPERKKQ